MTIMNNRNTAVVWLLVRLYVGYNWLTAGWGKITNPAWVKNGEALLGFWNRAVAIPEAPAKPAITYDWFRTFLNAMIDGGHHVWFGKLVAVGEVLVGLALILGFATIFAAAMGALMNWAFLMAGTASTNGMLLALAFLLILGGTYAGYLGVDYFFRPIYRGFMDKKVWRKNATETA